MIRELKREVPIQDYSKIRIRIASPEKIRDWSYGEVTKPETLNYRTFKPEKDGLFCERIFGPERDYECACGKYKKRRLKGLICDRCGVEITSSRVRRRRMGHIELAVPVAHIWFFKSIPSPLKTILDLKLKDLERVLYYESYIVIAPGPSDYEVKDIIDEEEYLDAKSKYDGTDFHAEMGAEAIRKLLKDINMEELTTDLRTRITMETSNHRKKKLIKRLKIVDSFRKSGNRPEWMILEVLPVLPPDLRPLVHLEGGQFATADFNDLYRRVITRNNRLKQLLEIHAPEVILKNEKRMLQEAVDALLDNSRKSRPVKGRGNRPLKSLSDQLKGKQGRFRLNLLGKRVDYSGRSVIVVDPDLKIDQCGLPKKMALELFKPFIVERIGETESVGTKKQVRQIIEKKHPKVWKVLEDIIQDHPVLLNRAPTLHRLGIQAFQPILIEEKAIKLHPLACTPFNADFDGDMMGVHVPLSYKAQMEARVLMSPVNNILSPANGRPILSASQDLVLGAYYLTNVKTDKPKDTSNLPIFNSPDEAILAYEEEKKIECGKMKSDNSDNKMSDIASNSKSECSIHSWVILRLPYQNNKRIITTIGRIIFNEILPKEIGFQNYVIDKGRLNKITLDIFRKLGASRAAKYLDDMKNITFKYSTKSGITFSLDDVIVPKSKKKILEKAEKEVNKIIGNYMSGIITETERYNRVIDKWKVVTEDVTQVMMDELANDRNGFNPIWMMAISGARGGKDQIKQLGAMRGLMEKPQKTISGGIGEIIETPIKANFKEGLNILEYFISTHGARKGLADTALKTAEAGYLTRRLIDVAQDVIISCEDCGTMRGITVTPLKEGNKIVEPISERIKGRTAASDITDPTENKIIVHAGEIITDDIAMTIQKHGINSVTIHSVLTCEAEKGICSKCYGRNLSTYKPSAIGDPVGVIAAQSIGEPGTQLTLRTFHIGGTASTAVEQAEVNSEYDGIVKFERMNLVTNRENKKISISYLGKIHIIDENTGDELEHYNVKYGANVFVEDNQKIVSNTLLYRWDPYNTPFIARKSGKVTFENFVKDITYKSEFNEITGGHDITILESKDRKIQAQLVIEDKNGAKESIPLPAGLSLDVSDGEYIYAGDILGKTSRITLKQRDITGGLPRIIELFEARSPKDKAVITEIDGEVKIEEIVRAGRKIIVKNEQFEQLYIIPHGKRIIVHHGDYVQNGDPLSDGPLDPHDILKARGVNAAQEFVRNEIQEIYRKQGVKIDDKHIGIIVRQMMSKVKIINPGDTLFSEGEIVSKHRLAKENEMVIKDGGEPSTSEPIILGITKAALMTDSFISAASFQETTRVLTEASIAGKIDNLEGLKESVIVGRKIPAGTGVSLYEKLLEEKMSELNNLGEVTKELLFKEDIKKQADNSAQNNTEDAEEH